ncbi:MAG: adaptor protein MecA [Lachnospiraceae bacterium]|nr:adaptor protein MecA [Lachnospiraceae bacterium]
MHIVEVDKYRVECHVSRKDLHIHGITVDDIINRTPLARIFFQKAAELAKNSTDYEWPHSAYSMQMQFYASDIVITFSERVDDYIYNLKQTAMTMPSEDAVSLEKMIYTLESLDESSKRTMISNFERSVRDVISDN